MYSMENYQWGLLGYLIGVVLVLWYLIRLIKRIPFRGIRHTLIILFTVFLLTPMLAYPDQYFVAPAFVVMFFEGVLGTGEGDWQRGFTPILFMTATTLTLYLFYRLWRYRYLKKKALREERAKHVYANQDE